MGKSSSFSFHCMICFEEFDPEERYPVVLPCGHTYICCVCSQRLDKCMECRTPLYWNIPSSECKTASRSSIGNISSASRSSTWSASSVRRTRSGGINAMSSAVNSPAQTVRRRLPLAKNLVLLSLIEDVMKARNSDDVNPETALEEECCRADFSKASQSLTEEEEEQHIKLSTTVAAGVAGTYAVAAQEGLPIFSTLPGCTTEKMDSNKQNGRQDRHDTGKDDVDELVRLFQFDKKAVANLNIDRDAHAMKESKLKEPPPAHLCFGDRVQIVSLEGGWAKLARGHGYVQVDKNQLVKVGGSVDRACKLEAMIQNVSMQRKQLRIKQTKADHSFIRLVNDLEISLVDDEDLTITAVTAYEDREVEDTRGEEESSDRQGSSQRFSLSPENKEVADCCPSKPPEQRGKQAIQAQENASYACFGDDYFGVSSFGSDLVASPTIPASSSLKKICPTSSTCEGGDTGGSSVWC